MEKVRPWCGQPADRGRLKEQDSIHVLTVRVCRWLHIAYCSGGDAGQSGGGGAEDTGGVDGSRAAEGCAGRIAGRRSAQVSFMIVTAMPSVL